MEIKIPLLPVDLKRKQCSSSQHGRSMISSTVMPIIRSDMNNDKNNNNNSNSSSVSIICDFVSDNNGIQNVKCNDSSVTVVSDATTRSNNLQPEGCGVNSRCSSSPSYSSSSGEETLTTAAFSTGSSNLLPRQYVEEAFRSNGFDDFESIVSSCKSRVKPITKEMLRAYSGDIVTVVRNNDLNGAQRLYERGTILKGVNACNRFGESVLHLACRRGYVDMVKFLVEDVGLNVAEIRDDYNRTPLHDAFWAALGSDALDVVDFLLKQPHVTGLLLCEDARGYTPLDYTREEDKDSWLSFFSERIAELRPLKTTSTITLANANELITVNEPYEISEKKKRKTENLIVDKIPDKEYVDPPSTQIK